MIPRPRAGKALQSETSDFPVNLPVPDVGQPVQNLAIEHDQGSAGADRTGSDWQRTRDGSTVMIS
jgi:hypothetical protein